MFRIFNQKRGPAERISDASAGAFTPKGLTWEHKPLPGQGAMQYSWETYGLPGVARFGFGNINVTNPLRETSPFGIAMQTVPQVGGPYAGAFQGQFVTQPLMDPNNAAALGIVTPNSQPAPPNAVQYGGGVLPLSG
jgi:hypothetical protein